jgi:hypothetical protein
MIGPVQLVMIGYPDPELPVDVRRQVDDLRANPAVRLLDVQIYHKERGVVSRQDVNGFTTDARSDPGNLVDRMMTSAASSEVLSGGAPSGQGYLMRGDAVPDPKHDVPDDTNVLVLLLEHSWATPLWNSVRENRAFPVADAWMGRQSLQSAGLQVG